MNNPLSGNDESKLDFLAEMAEDVEDLPSDSKIEKIRELCRRQLAIENKILHLEEQLSFQKDSLKKISTFDLPTAMMEAGCKKFVTEEGVLIEVKAYYTAKIDDENREQCFSWLHSRGFSGIIKHQIVANFNKGEDSLATSVKQVLTDVGATYTDKESVHPQTLNAFVKERYEKGEEFPIEMFKGFVGQVAKLKRA